MLGPYILKNKIIGCSTKKHAFLNAYVMDIYWTVTTIIKNHSIFIYLVEVQFARLCKDTFVVLKATKIILMTLQVGKWGPYVPSPVQVRVCDPFSRYPSLQLTKASLLNVVSYPKITFPFTGAVTFFPQSTSWQYGSLSDHSPDDRQVRFSGFVSFQSPLWMSIVSHQCPFSVHCKEILCDNTNPVIQLNSATVP